MWGEGIATGLEGLDLACLKFMASLNSDAGWIAHAEKGETEQLTSSGEENFQSPREFCYLASINAGLVHAFLKPAVTRSNLKMLQSRR